MFGLFSNSPNRYEGVVHDVQKGKGERERGGGVSGRGEEGVLTAIIASQTSRVEVLALVLVRHLLNSLSTLLGRGRRKSEGRGRRKGRSRQLDAHTH